MFAPTLSPFRHDFAEGIARGQSGFAKWVWSAQDAVMGHLTAWSPRARMPQRSFIPSPVGRSFSSRVGSALFGPRWVLFHKRHVADHASVIAFKAKSFCDAGQNALNSGVYQNQTRGSLTCVNPPSFSHSSRHRFSRAAWQPTASVHSAAQLRVQSLLTQPIQTWLPVRLSARSQAAIATTRASVTKPTRGGFRARNDHRVSPTDRGCAHANRGFTHTNNSLTGGFGPALKGLQCHHRGITSGGVLHSIDQQHETGAQGHFAPMGRD
jgi:hypothetical protein